MEKNTEIPAPARNNKSRRAKSLLYLFTPFVVLYLLWSLLPFFRIWRSYPHYPAGTFEGWIGGTLLTRFLVNTDTVCKWIGGNMGMIAGKCYFHYGWVD